MCDEEVLDARSGVSRVPHRYAVFGRPICGGVECVYVGLGRTRYRGGAVRVGDVCERRCGHRGPTQIARAVGLQHLIGRAIRCGEIEAVQHHRSGSVGRQFQVGVGLECGYSVVPEFYRINPQRSRARHL